MAYKLIYIQQSSIYNLEGESEPRFDPTDNVLSEINLDYIVSSLSPKKKQIVSLLMEGYNFNQIYPKLKIKQSQIYKLKSELKKDLAPYRDDIDGGSRYLRRSLSRFDKFCVEQVRKMSVPDFMTFYLMDYDTYRDKKEWHNQTMMALSGLIYKLFLRDTPVQYQFYHKDNHFTEECFRRINRVIKASPIVCELLQPLETEDMKVQLRDGSSITAVYSLKKHPRVRVLCK